MKNKFLLRLMAIALASTMILAGCSSDDEPSESSPPDADDVGSSQSSTVEPDVEMRDKIELSDKIETGIKRNADTQGWLTIPNLEIDDAVLQRNDPKADHLANNNYYLRIDEDKKYDIFGCYFLDPDSKMGDRDDLSKNTIIYGHSDYKDIGTGPKFTQLFNYNDLEFLEENPYIYFSTEEEDMVWQIFSVFYTDLDFYYIEANPSDAAFGAILKEAKSKNEYIIDVPVTTKDKILTLSTCTGAYVPGDRDSYRYVVMAKLLPTTDVPEGAVEVKRNPSPELSK